MQENKYGWVQTFVNVIDLSYNLTDYQDVGYKY
jgi:hypothetical protein